MKSRLFKWDALLISLLFIIYLRIFAGSNQHVTTTTTKEQESFIQRKFQLRSKTTSLLDLPSSSSTTMQPVIPPISSSSSSKSSSLPKFITSSFSPTVSSPKQQPDLNNLERLKKHLDGKKILVYQADNRDRSLWFNDRVEKYNDFSRYVSISILKSYTWAQERGYAYLFHSRPERIECAGPNGIDKRHPLSRHWCKLPSLLLGYDIAKRHGMETFLYLDTDAYPSKGGQFSLEEFLKQYENIPPILIAADQGGWALFASKFGVYLDTVCTGIILFQVTPQAEEFLHKVWYESTSWTTPYEVLKSQLELSFLASPSNSWIRSIDPNLGSLVNFEYGRKKESLKAKIMIHTRLPDQSKFFFDFKSTTNRSILDDIVNRCCITKNAPPKEICFQLVVNETYSVPSIPTKCKYTHYSTMEKLFPSDMDRFNWLKELYPGIARSATFESKKIILNMTPMYATTSPMLISHRSSKIGHQLIETGFESDIQNFQQQTSKWKTTHDIIDPINWTMATIKSEIPVISFLPSLVHLPTKSLLEQVWEGQFLLANLE